MTVVLGTNIISPLGRTSRENYESVKCGRSALRSLEGWKGVPERITASVFDRNYGFEEMVSDSIEAALKGTGVDPSSPRTVLILSTTKGDIESLDPQEPERYPGLAAAAGRIAGRFGMVTAPIIVCNACISGGNAQLLAARLLDSSVYDNAIVCGADTVSAFTVSGFLSFKALSPFECRPFDIERLGLNLGEAAATMVFGRSSAGGENLWTLESGALTNDAYHVSAPSPDGDGVCRAISAVAEAVLPDDIDCISLHGTATMFNDQMESKAVQRAGLSDVPACALKGYYGHTLGAAGLVETIITMEALEDGVILPTRGFVESGVSGRISLSGDLRASAGKGRFIKVLSGFGGCNCALRYGRAAVSAERRTASGGIVTLGRVRLDASDDLEEIYRTRLESYPKFHKMDALSKLLYVASELLLRETPDAKPSAAVIFNGTSSILQDRRHISAAMGGDGFFPSPSVFLYTLPNVAVGEIAIRNGIKGETSLYILRDRDPELMESIVEASLPAGTTALTGWVDYGSDTTFEADLRLITKK